ncbi:MAG: hypothetical protein ACYCYL_00800 [Acidithiobacillus sp.]
MLIAAFVFHSEVLPVLFTTTILLLVILGAVAAKAGGASMIKGALGALSSGSPLNDHHHADRLPAWTCGSLTSATPFHQYRLERFYPRLAPLSFA